MLSPGESEIDKYLEQDVTVVCKKAYLDLQFNRIVKPGEKYKVTQQRADHLMELKLVDILE